MKIIHCADLHLDSKMTTNLDKEKATERKLELLNAYNKMLNYATSNDVDAIIIAGDLFDTRSITKRAKNTVLDGIYSHESIEFYYLQGNHDSLNFFDEMEELPANLHLFDDTWKSYNIGNVVITGAELDKNNKSSIYNSLVLDNDMVNIVVMHGQESASKSDKTETINLKQLRNKGIDYLALGHIHTYKKEKLDNRGVYCYSGCLEGRGFDECGPHGFVLLDIDEETKKIESEFIEISFRNLYEVNVDVTGCMTTREASVKVKEMLDECDYDSRHLIKIVLSGEVDFENDIDEDTLLAEYKDDYYFMKVYNETNLKVDYNEYAKDESLKGEFVRLIMEADDIPEEEKPFVIKYGIKLLKGEEV